MRRRRFLGAPALLLGAPLARAWAAAPRALTLQLDWKLNAQFAGVLLADHEGLYEARDLAVTVRPWSSGIVVPDVVAASETTLGCAEQNLVLAAQARGAPIRAVATMFQTSPLALMSLPKTNIGSLSDLVGKAVGMHVDGMAVMPLVQGVSGMAQDAIAVRQVSYEEKFDALLSGELTAVQCYAVDEPIRFEQQTGVSPAVLPLGPVGHDAYAQVIFAHEALLDAASEAVVALLAATFDGWRRALADIPAAATVIVERYAEPGSRYTNVDYQRRSLERVAAYVTHGLPAGSLGYIDPARWQRMSERFAEYGIVNGVPPVERSLAAGLWPV